MIKINNPKVKRARAGKIVGVIVGAVMLLLAVLCFFMKYYTHRDATFNSVAFADAYNDERLEEDILVYIDVNEEPYEIGHYDKDEQYYYVSDGYDLYIIRCSEKQYENIKAEVEADGVSEVMGTVTELNDEVIETALEEYNEGEEDPDEIVTREEFDQYFQGVGLMVGGQVGAEADFVLIGVLLGIFGTILFIAALVELHSYNKTLRNLSEVDAQVITAELDSPQTVYLKKCRTYLTPRYIVSMGNRLTIMPYTDILWAYRFNQRYNFVTVLTNVKIYTRYFQTIAIADMAGIVFGKDAVIQQIFEVIQMHNPQARFGYSEDLKNYFYSLPRMQQNTTQNAS